MFRQGCFSLTTIILALLLTACAGDGKKWNPEDYTVKSGDTVYSIAWRYEIDPEDFAAWNNLGDDQLIKPGQRLHTRRPANFTASRNVADDRAEDIAYVPVAPTQDNRSYSQQDKVKARKGDSLYRLSKRYGISIKQLAQLNQLKEPYIIQPGQTIYLKPLSSPATKTKTTTTQTAATQKPTTQTSASKTQKPQTKKISWPTSIRWQKPANGKLVKKFNRQLIDAKGIDIAGRQGDPVVASADGKVVYSGNGLISYGNLIIIKHNKTFLSAYAYNRKLLVKEGDIVKAGQKIAEMGRKDQLSPRLHFEIRKNGKPDDPLKYLPW